MYKNDFTEKKHFSEIPQKNLPEIQKTQLDFKNDFTKKVLYTYKV